MVGSTQLADSSNQSRCSRRSNILYYFKKTTGIRPDTPRRRVVWRFLIGRVPTRFAARHDVLAPQRLMDVYNVPNTSAWAFFPLLIFFFFCVWNRSNSAYTRFKHRFSALPAKGIYSFTCLYIYIYTLCMCTGVIFQTNLFLAVFAVKTRISE